MNSKLRIYRCTLTPDRNALVDDLDDYLGSLTPSYSSDDFQYQKLGLDISIKVSAPQDSIINGTIGNYAVIEQDGKKWYYFVIGVNWTAQKTVELTLSIDSINTFRNDLHWSDQTSIVRQHGDRFIKDQSNNVLIRRIDPETEGIQNAKVLISNTKVNQPNLDYDWYLMYRTSEKLSEEDLTNPVECRLFASERLKYRSPSSEASKTITADDLLENYYYYFTNIDNPGGTFKINSTAVSNPSTLVLGNEYSVPGADAEVTKRTLLGLILFKQGNQLYYSLQWNNAVAYQVTGGTFYYDIVSPTFIGYPLVARLNTLAYCNSVVLTLANNFQYTAAYLTTPSAVELAETSNVTLDIGGAELIINSINDIDRTDSRLMKIIKLPYAPVNIRKQGDIYVFPDVFTYDNGTMLLDRTKLFYNFQNDLTSLSVPELFLTHSTAISPTQPKARVNESKLYHSDFYTYKMVYDSFASDLKLEALTVNPTPDTVWSSDIVKIPIVFKPTNTMNSNFAFKFDYDGTPKFITGYKLDGDYGDYLLVTRNNEETLFNSDYVNYIRTGYNYDKKVRSMQLTQNIVSIVAQGVQAVASLGIAPAVQKKLDINRALTREAIDAGAAQLLGTSPLEQPISAGVWRSVQDLSRQHIIAEASKQSSQRNQFTISQGIAASSGIINSIGNTIISDQQALIAMEQKKLELAAQSTATVGSDDMDLLSFYNGNRLEVKKYAPLPEVQDGLFNLFYYCGYSYPRMEVPNITSRYWFNFIQCTPKFIEEGSSPYNDYITDIKARYEAGVTVYHHHNGWDWGQQYENWETKLIGGTN